MVESKTARRFLTWMVIALLMLGSFGIMQRGNSGSLVPTVLAQESTDYLSGNGSSTNAALTDPVAAFEASPVVVVAGISDTPSQ